MTTPQSDLGRRIWAARLALGWGDRRQLAEEAGVPVELIAAMEEDHCTRLPPETATRIEKAMGLAQGWLSGTGLPEHVRTEH